MDIYSFIRSRDVAEHCRDIGKTWNTYEMAVIIGRSNRRWEEKHSAWRDLMKIYPDMPMPEHKGMFNGKTPKNLSSIFNEVVKRIDYEEYVLKLFKEQNTGAFYKYWIYDCESWSELSFDSYENALEDAMCINITGDLSRKILIEKTYTDSEKKQFHIEAVFESDSRINSWYAHGSEKAHKKLFPDYDFNDIAGFLDDGFTYVYIPMPFKRGDILSTNGEDIFVLDRYDGDEPASDVQERIDRLSGVYNYMTEGWGYFVNENGCLFGDHVNENDIYEYYKGKLTGNNRLLHYLSLYIKDEIGIAELLNMQWRIILEYQLSSNLNIDSHGCSIPDHLLAENRLSINEEEKAQ